MPAIVKLKRVELTHPFLSIALKLTQLLKGEIRVESELNVGTAFYLSFPLSKIGTPVKTSEKIIKDQLMNFLSGKVILIAEDAEYNYRYLEILLSKNHDVRILWAKNGLEAVDFCRKYPEIDIVLMDIQLPELNGLDATRLIKSENKNIPVIAQTAYASPIDIQTVFEAGCNDILLKPINKNELFRKIAEWLR